MPFDALEVRAHGGRRARGVAVGDRRDDLFVLAEAVMVRRRSPGIGAQPAPVHLAADRIQGIEKAEKQAVLRRLGDARWSRLSQFSYCRQSGAWTARVMQWRNSAIAVGVAFSAATRAISGSIEMRALTISIGLVRRAIEATSEAVSIGRLPAKVPLPTWRQTTPRSAGSSRPGAGTPGSGPGGRRVPAREEGDRRRRGPHRRGTRAGGRAHPPPGSSQGSKARSKNQSGIGSDIRLPIPRSSRLWSDHPLHFRGETTWNTLVSALVRDRMPRQFRKLVDSHGGTRSIQFQIGCLIRR